MGAFRDFFYWIFNDYVKNPLDSIKSTLDTGLVEPLRRSVDDISSTIREIIRVVTDLRTAVLEVVVSVRTIYDQLGNVVEYIRDVRDRIDDIDLGIGMIEYVKELVDDTFLRIFTKLKPNLIEELKLEIATSSINEGLFMSADMKQKVSELKAKWSHSPESASDIAHDVLDVVIGKVSKVQLEAIAGISFDESTPVVNNLFNQLAILTDVTLATNLLSVIAEVLSIGQIDKIGQELRSYLDYSGFSQISGYGYGMILSSALSASVNQELNAKMLNTPVDPATLIRLRYKQLIDESTYDQYMKSAGFADVQRKCYEDDYLFYPSPQDLVHWISKEVFEDESISKYGLMNEFDRLDLSLFRKAGLTEEQVRNFWVAHWDAPSFGQVTEMLFRGLISEEDVYDWYRLVEIPPFWREKLTKIQYHPYTRVDIRRMYIAGVVDRETVKRTYLDLGYDEEKAENLTVWTTAEKISVEKDLTKAEILRLYKEGQLTLERAKEQIIGLGYDADEADLVLLLAELQRQDQEEKDIIETLTDRFKLHIIDLRGLEEGLNTLDITEVKKQRIITKALRIEESFIQLPSKTDLKSWFKGDIIDADEYTTGMLSLGYSIENIDRYIKEMRL